MLFVALLAHYTGFGHVTVFGSAVIFGIALSSVYPLILSLPSNYGYDLKPRNSSNLIIAYEIG